MSRWDKALQRVLDGRADHNIRFGNLRGLLLRLGFDERINGDHYAFGKPGVREIIDLQPLKDGKAKAYQSGRYVVFCAHTGQCRCHETA